MKLDGVADGEISATSTQVVNGSQLHQVYNLLGGSSSVDTKLPETTDATGNKLPIGTVQTSYIDNQGNPVTKVDNNVTVAVSKDPTGKDYTLTTYNVEDRTEFVTNDVIQAIGKMNEQGIRFFHTNDGKVNPVVQNTNSVDSSASGAYATAIGYRATASGTNSIAFGGSLNPSESNLAEDVVTKAVADNAVAIGTGAIAGQAVTDNGATTVVGKNAIAIGTHAQALADNTIAIGTGNIVTGKNSGAIGDPSNISGDNSYSVGNNNTLSTNNTFVLGNNVTQTLDNSVGLGSGTAMTAGSAAGTNNLSTTGETGTTTTAGDKGTVNSATIAGVTYEGFAGATANGVVSVGAAGDERRIQNVAAGEISATSTDAINGSQLNATNTAINNLTGNVTNIGNAINTLNKRVGEVQDEANAGVSSAMAMASLPQAYIPGKSMLTGGVASYNGESAVAVGLSKLSDNGRWVLKISGSADTQGNAGGAIGAGFHF